MDSSGRGVRLPAQGGSVAGGSVAIVGGGPAGVLTAIALARRGIRSTVLEREQHPGLAPRTPDGCYTVDVTGHGLRAVRYVEATPYLDARMLRFKGIQQAGRVVEGWSEPGWTGSRGDILRALLDLVGDHYAESVDLLFETAVSDVEVRTGTVTWESASGGRGSGRFDLVVGADGAGSLVRRALQQQVPGFVVHTTSIPNYVTIIELSRVGDRLDKHYLQALSVRHFNVAGAVNGDEGCGSPRWFCCVGSKEALAWRCLEDAKDYFRRVCPAILELASDDDIAAFVRRPGSHVGRTASCSQLHAGRAVLLGDAAAAFPPIGQGVNAALESASVLDRCIGQAGDELVRGAARYDAAWKPEADAVTWIAQRVLFEEPLSMLRAGVTALLSDGLGEDVHGPAAAELPYSEVRRRAERLAPAWI